jgi:1,4-dihydroxy-2-naphthoate octaprenyltransferase
MIAAFIANESNEFDGCIFGWAVLTTILLQILANFANDYGDAVNGADNSQRIGPERMVQSGAISLANMKKGITVTIGLTLLSGITLLFFSFGNWFSDVKVISLFVIGLISIIAALKYTAGKKPYGYKALGDFSVFVFFGIVGVLGNIFLYTHQVDLLNLLPAASIGALSMAVLNLNNMRDRPEDAKVGKRTIPVLIGQKNAKTYHVGLLMVALVCAVLYSVLADRVGFHLIFLIPFLFLSAHVVRVMNVELPKDFDPELKKVALSTFVFSILFGIGLML